MADQSRKTICSPREMLNFWFKFNLTLRYTDVSPGTAEDAPIAMPSVSITMRIACLTARQLYAGSPMPIATWVLGTRISTHRHDCCDDTTFWSFSGL